MVVVWTGMMFDEKSINCFKTYSACYALTILALIAHEIIPYIFRG